MKIRITIIAGLLLIFSQTKIVTGQGIGAAIQQGFKKFTNDDQLKYAVVGFSVQDAAGSTIFAHQENYGLAPASCQKIVTAATALDKLGSSYRYATSVGYNGKIAGGQLQGDLLVQGSGDPTLGSWRYPSVPDTAFFEQVLQALKAKGISQITGDVIGSNSRFSVQAIPQGWIYGDIGNYYGAGTWALNYHENQYHVIFNASGTQGDKLSPKKFSPDPGIEAFNSFAQLGAAGSGDNSIIYAPPYAPMAYITGTLGKTNQPFTVSGSMPHGEEALLTALANYLANKGIKVAGRIKPSLYFSVNNTRIPATTTTLTNFQSVAMDSIIYWFLQKSINLYGEALAKTLAIEAGKIGDTEAGTEWIRNYWASKGIDRFALKLTDGCGLSPQNRVTAKSLVQVLQYAKKQSWFNAFYDGLPTIHNIKMKSGTISGCKGFTGYINAKDGQQYSFALIVNNYSGAVSSVVQKMYQLLDVIAAYK